jgi:solute carrier family 6 amino acid transporter-like protein 5/7/9/14
LFCRDTFILSISNFLTCILAGLVVFAYIGALSETTGLAVDKVAQTGQGLVYVVFPYAVTQLDVSPLWSVMFFVMMLALGMGTMMASVETLNTSLVDFFPVLGRNGINRALTLAVICAVYFLVDLILCSQAGTYWIELFDTYSANWAILIMAIVECVSVGWIYGEYIRRILNDVDF